MKLEKRKEIIRSVFQLNGVWLSIVSLLLAMVVSGLIMAVCGYNPFEAFGAIFAGAFQSKSGLAQT